MTTHKCRGRFAFLTALALVIIMFCFGGNVSDANAASCAAAVKLCTKSAKKLGASTAKTLAQCREVRECRQECRGEKRSEVKGCRGNKRDCRSDCRKRFGKGRDFRKCVRSCRKDKRSCTRDARQEKRSCRKVCRSTFLTPECRRARLKVLGSSLKSIAACATLVSCAKPAP
jgi:hypothetical protein